MNTIYIALGSNLGDSVGYLKAALGDLANHPDFTLLAHSSFYQSAPVECAGSDYINAVAKLRTALSAPEVLQALQKLELKHDRKRTYRNAPRTLDLDVLLYNSDIRRSEELTIPHPRMHQRAFVLEPLLEIAPKLNLQQGPVHTLLKLALRDGQVVQRLDIQAPMLEANEA